MPLHASGSMSLSQIKAYWDSKAGQQTKNLAGTANVASPAGQNDLGYYVAKTYHTGVRASDIAPSGAFPAAVALAHFYNVSPIGEGAASNCTSNCTDCNCSDTCNGGG